MIFLKVVCLFLVHSIPRFFTEPCSSKFTYLFNAKYILNLLTDKIDHSANSWLQCSAYVLVVKNVGSHGKSYMCNVYEKVYEQDFVYFIDLNMISHHHRAFKQNLKAATRDVSLPSDRRRCPPIQSSSRAHGVGRVVGALGSEAGFAGSMLN